METSLFVYVFLFIGLFAFQQTSLAHDMNSQLVVVHSKGPNWPSDREVPFDDPEVLKHAKYWSSQKIIERGGPFEGTFDDLMLLKPGTSLELASKISAEDPSVKSGLLKAEVRRWLLFIEKVKVPAKKSAKK